MSRLLGSRPSAFALSYVRVGPVGVRSASISRPYIYARFQSSSSSSTTAAVVPKSRIGQFIQQSKELLAFYKNGLKLLWDNNKAVKVLQGQVSQGGYELTRAEYQLVHRTKKDMRKLIPFGILLFILPESIPFFVVFVPGLIPSTCIKHAQLEKQREKLDKQRQIMSSNVLRSAQVVKGISPNDFLSVPRFSKINSHYGYDFALDKIDRRHLSAYCRFMGLSSLGTSGMLRNRLAQYFTYISKDDELLSIEGIDTLTLHELQHANEERGMRSLAKDEDALRSSLKYWLATRSIEPEVPTGLLVFSRMFLLNANYGANKIASLQN